MENRIRRGGLQTASGFLFELTGGVLALDFVNTVDSRPMQDAKELLPTYNELISWGRQTGLVTQARETALRKKAKQEPEKAESVRKLAIQIRECMFQILSKLTDHKDVPREILTEWNRIVHRSMAHYELVPDTEGLSWRCRAEDLELDSILWPIVHSAVQLVTGTNSLRIRKCAAEACDWMFLDTSKRGNRRWCDMTVCGNRAKARRFYLRRKAE